jgi:hypothetical protein
MKTLFKLMVFALGLAVIALSVITLVNQFRDTLCMCGDDDFDGFVD